jgi:hypothetical protein
MFGDRNPFMAPIEAWAKAVHAERRSASPDNPLLAFERMVSGWIADGLKAWGDARDAMMETIFFSTYGSPLLQAIADVRADGISAGRRIERDLARETNASRMAAYLEQHIDKGGSIEAAVRALIFIRRPEGRVDERGFAALKEIAAALPAAKRVGFARFKEVVREQYLILLRDEERAIAALPNLLPEDRREREAAFAMVQRVLAARGALPEEGRRRLKRIETLFAGPTPGVAPQAAE